MRRGLLIALTAAFVLGVSILLAANSAGLRQELNHSTQAYLQDVTTQTTSDIRDTIQHKIQDLQGISSSIVALRESGGEDSIQEFLNEKAQTLEFEPLILVDRQGTVLASQPVSALTDESIEELIQLPHIQASFDGETHTSYLGGETDILYSTPVYTDGDVTEVLIGVRRRERMQAMIAAKHFSGRSISCIVDTRGTMVLAPVDMQPFVQLNEIFADSNNQEVIDEIQGMQEGMSAGRGGILRFTSVSGEDLFLAYNALEINDWVLLTVIPADILTGGAAKYVFFSFFLVGATILLLVLLFWAVFWFSRAHQKHLEELAFLDPVTGGLNNAAFQMCYRDRAPSMEPGAYTIVLLNVRGFKFVNERFGTQTGNDSLRYLYQVLSRHVRAGEEWTARGEDDSFFLCLKESQPEAIQKRLDDAIFDINSFSDVSLPYGEMVMQQGACVVEDPKQEITLLQDRARMAYQSRRLESQSRCVFYDERIAEQLKTEQELDELFDESLARGDFQVYFQPKIGLESGRLEGAEALIRWNHPQKGMISPGEFIPLFEKNGKIRRLDFYVFQTVCGHLRQWQEEEMPLIPISVNLSRQHFQDPSFLESFCRTAEAHCIPHGLLEFELTESIFFDDRQIQAVKDRIQQMHACGFLCSLDDFGSGFSSLGLLREFDVDSIKLDRRFFLNLDNAKAQDVVDCLLDLARRLRLKTVAEGIETEEQLAFLRTVRCDQIQGFVFSRPLPLPEFEAFAAQHR